jgi:hypothetical protein
MLRINAGTAGVSPQGARSTTNVFSAASRCRKGQLTDHADETSAVPGEEIAR